MIIYLEEYLQSWKLRVHLHLSKVMQEIALIAPIRLESEEIYKTSVPTVTFLNPLGHYIKSTFKNKVYRTP